MKKEKFMKAAIKETKLGIKDGQSPFGAAIVKDGKIIALAHSTVLKDKDSTCHAEINAIRKACKKLKSENFLSGCEIYSTTEPCPMCFSAIHWARIDKIYFGTKIADAKKAGFNELTVSNHLMKSKGKSPVKLVSNFLKPECLKLFDIWGKRKDKKAY